MVTGLAIYLTCVTALLGLVVGSFLNCVAWRIVRGESWVSGRSHCDACGHVLEPRDLVPVVSWLSTRGRCRYCGAKVSARNPATEIGCAILYVAILWRYCLPLKTLEMCGLASVLLVASLTDLDDYLIPNGCIVAAVVIRILYLMACAFLGQDVGPVVRASLVGAVAVTVPLLVLVLIMDHMLGKPSMGGGDLKLFAVAGLYFGWQQGIFLVMVACVLGIAFGLVGRRQGEKDGAPADDVPAHAFPFGPSIAAAMVITMLCGHQVLGWYLGLLL